MEDLLSGIDGRFKVLMGDSTILCILHNAMNKAHEKVRSKQGVIERLNEQSKFCELAIMQLEICLKFVQEETGNYVLDNTYAKLLSDLTEIKNRLQLRLKETEIALAKKDKEIVEKDRALVAKEEELKALRRYKEERKEGNFCELKNSVDQQFWSIKQHLEDERMAITKRISRGSSSISSIDDLEVINVAGEYGMIGMDGDDLSPSKLAFDQMGFEINKLKETLDVAFGIMQNTVLDVCTSEVQWMRMVESDIQFILSRDFIMNLKDKLVFYPEQWSNLIEDVIMLRDELKQLVNLREVKTRRLKSGHESQEFVGDQLLENYAHEDYEATTRIKREELRDINNLIKRLDDFLKLKSKLSVISNSEDVKFEKAMADLQCVVNSGKKMICSIDNVDNENESELIKTDIEEDSIRRFKATKEMYDCLTTSLRNEFEIKMDEYEMRKSIQIGSCSNMMNQVVKEFKIYVEKRKLEWNNILEDHNMMLHLNEGVWKFVLKETMREIETKTTSSILLAHKHETYLLEKTLTYDDNLLYCHLQEDVESLLLKEMAYLWRQEFESYKFEHDIRLEVLQCALLEIAKDCLEVIGVYAAFLKDESSDSNTNTNIEKNRNENTIKRQDYMSHDMDIHIHMKESMQLGLVTLDVNKVHMLNKHDDGKSAENEVSVGEVTSELENCTQQSSIETISKEFECDEEINASDNGVVHQDLICNPSNSTPFCDNQISFYRMFDELNGNFEGKMNHKLNLYDLRLQQMSSHVQKLIKQLSVCKKKEILYKKAFILRCQNLHKAETEVDVLGDQVNTLAGLLERIYRTLDYYSPVLQHFSGVLDILIWIRKELNLGVTTHMQHGF